MDTLVRIDDEQLELLVELEQQEMLLLLSVEGMGFGTASLDECFTCNIIYRYREDTTDQ